MRYQPLIASPEIESSEIEISISFGQKPIAGNISSQRYQLTPAGRKGSLERYEDNRLSPNVCLRSSGSTVKASRWSELLLVISISRDLKPEYAVMKCQNSL